MFIVVDGVLHLFQFLPVYHPSDEEMNQPKLFARNVQVLMAKYANSTFLYNAKNTKNCKLFAPILHHVIT